MHSVLQVAISAILIVFVSEPGEAQGFLHAFFASQPRVSYIRL